MTLLALNPCNRRGMTLLELMLVLAIMAGLCAAALPGILNTSYPRYCLKQAARRLVCDMYYAKIQAVSTNRQHRIVFDTENNSYRLESGDRSRQSKTWSLEDHVSRFGSAVKDADFSGICLLSVSREKIVFNPIGEQTAMCITLRHERGQIMKIYSSRTGRIRMERAG